MKRLSFFLALELVFCASCSTQRGLVYSEPKFNESARADLIVRYYSDNISRILKPLQMEGPFLSTFDRGSVLALAKEQPGRGLAVVVLLKFNASDRVKQSWMTPLTELGYKRVVFLRAEDGRKLDGLPILEGPPQVTRMQREPSETKEDRGATTGG